MGIVFLLLTLDKTTLQTLYKGPCHKGLYPILSSCNFQSRVPSFLNSESAAFVSTTSSSVEWHNKLGHPSTTLMQALLKQHDLPISRPVALDCSCCNMAKSHKLSFPLSETVSTRPFALVHMDVWGPSPVASNKGYKYYLLVIDDFSRYTWIFPLHYKSEVKYAISNFKAYVSTQFHTQIQNVRSDNGGEFVNHFLLDLFLTHGVIHQTTCPHTPEQNGIAERKHGHLIEMTITLLLQAKLPTLFWLEALCTAVYLANRLPHSSLQFKILYTQLFDAKPDYHFLKPFGCSCFPWLQPYRSNKLTPKSGHCIFLGYCPATKGYKCYDPKTTKVYVSRHVKFCESDFPFPNLINTSVSTSSTIKFNPPLTSFANIVISVLPSTSDSYSSSSNVISCASHSFAPSGSILSDQPHSPCEPNSVPLSTAPTSESTSSLDESVVVPFVPALPTHPMMTRAKHGIHKPKKLFALTAVPTSDAFLNTEPKNFASVVTSEVWQQAMATEYKALVDQNTWNLVPYPSHGNVIGCQWIYKIKRHSDGSVARYKACLVANGNQQHEGLDFSETFSPVIKQPTFRIVLSLAVHHQWSIRQLDVTNAFLRGVIEEEVFMKQPLGYQHPEFPDYVCKLNKALYGLRQAPRAWFDVFSGFLLQQGFKSSQSDSSLFVCLTSSAITYVLVYVDDILITGSDTSYISSLIFVLSDRFVMKDLGDLSYFLGIEVIHHGASIVLSQAKYTNDLLLKAGMSECKASASPSSVKPTPIEPDSEFLDPTWYRTVVGSLQYLTLTRPEISFAVNHACQHMHSPKQSNFIAVKRILRYLQGSVYQGLVFRPSLLTISAYSDADWAGDRVDRRSTTGYCVFLGPNLISWCAKKQHTVARSSTEAEYRSLAHTAADITWIHHLLLDLGITVSSPHPIWCDNMSAISLASNPVFHARTKHVEVDYHFIREKVLNHQIKVLHIGTLDQVADIFTKPLSVDRFQFLRSKLMVIDIPISLRGSVKQGH